MLGGPIIKNKAHFFVSLERQVDNPNRTRVFATRPDSNFSIAEDRTDWNTLIRFDHQINSTHTLGGALAARVGAAVARSSATAQTPESFQDETDLDQTAVGTLTSVLGNSQRQHRPRREDVGALVARQRLLPRAGPERRIGPASSSARRPTGKQSLCPPQLDYLSFLGQASTESQGPWDSNYQIEDDFSWFIPGKKGDHELKFGARYNYTELRRVSQINQNGTFTFNTDLRVQRRQPAHLSGTADHPDGRRSTRSSRTTPSSSTRRTSGRSAAGRR